jgi:hypothetical protein
VQQCLPSRDAFQGVVGQQAFEQVQAKGVTLQAGNNLQAAGLFKWPHPHQNRNMLLLWDLLICKVILLHDLINLCKPWLI